jgi:hypothetical protein
MSEPMADPPVPAFAPPFIDPPFIVDDPVVLPEPVVDPADEPVVDPLAPVVALEPVPPDPLVL